MFPLFAVAIAKVAPSTRRLSLLAILIASLASAIIVVRYNSSAAFYLPFTRFWELLAGSLLSAVSLPAPRHKWQADALGIAGLLLILFPALFYHSEMLFPGESAIPPCLGAVLILYAGYRQDGLVTRLLSLRPFVFIGLISYSLYLWHWPILVGSRYFLFRELTAAEQVVALVVMVAAAYASWRWVEQPFRTGNLSRPALFYGTGVIGVIAIGFALSTQLTNGLPERFTPAAQIFARAALDINPRRHECDRPSPENIGLDRVCMLGDLKAAAPSFLLIGDSFADAMMPGIEDAARAQGKKGYSLVYSGCFPLVGIQQKNAACDRFMDAAMDFVHRHPEIETAILVSRWTSAFYGNRFGALKGEGWFIQDRESREESYAENQRVFKRGFARLLGELSSKRIALVAFVPEQRYDIPRALALHSMYNIPATIELPLALHEERQEPLRRIFDGFKDRYRLSIIDIGKDLCNQSGCVVTKASKVLYADDNHLSASGARLAIADVLPSQGATMFDPPGAILKSDAK